MHQRVVLGLLLAVFLGFIAGCSKEKPQLSTAPDVVNKRMPRGPKG
jgi:hypothetical protein